MSRRYDLSKTKNTVTEIFKNNTEKFYNCKTKEELIDICHQLLDNADVDTEWTHEFFVRLGLIKSFEQARSYVYNAMLRGMGHGVIGYRRQYEECDGTDVAETEDGRFTYSNGGYCNLSGNRYNNLDYSKATPERNYIKVLKFIYDNPGANRRTIVTSVFPVAAAIRAKWERDAGHNERTGDAMRGYAQSYFGQLVNDGLLEHKKVGREARFTVTSAGEALLRRCGAI